MKTQETMAPHLRSWNEKNPMAKRPRGRMKGFGYHAAFWHISNIPFNDDDAVI
jgi:hypothetical protein